MQKVPLMNVHSSAYALTPVSLTMPGSAHDDPIYQRIAEYENLNAQADALCLVAERFESRLPKEVTGDARVALFRSDSCRDLSETRGVDDDGSELKVMSFKWHLGRGNMIYARSGDDIERNAESIPVEHRDIWIADRRGALARELRRMRRLRRESGFTAMNLRLRAAWDATSVAAMNLISTRPATLGGLIKLIRFAADDRERGGNLLGWQEDAAAILLENISEALKHL
jgi:hypothetical protein